jgi:AAA domain
MTGPPREPMPDGPELHARLAQIAAMRLVRLGPEGLAGALQDTLLHFANWPDAAARSLAGQIAAEAASWQNGQLLEHYRAWLGIESGPPEEARRAARLRALEDDQWARQQLRAAGRPPVTLVPAAGVWNSPDLSWLVDRKIPETGIGTIYGATGTWKSFLALHLILCVRYGLPFLGSPVNRRGWCFYLLGEGQAGARRRIRAAVADLPGDDGPPDGLAYSMQPFPLDDAGAVGDFTAQARQAAGDEPVALVVLDAAADFYPPGANENSATDMQPLIAQAKRIAAELGCFVLLIAHTGYEGGHVRGTSRFGQAWDFEAEVRWAASAGCGWLDLTKVKEDEARYPIPFHVVPVPTGPPGPDGQPPVSLAVRGGHPQGTAAQEAAQAAEDRKLTATEARVQHDIICYLHDHASRGKPLSFRRISKGVTGNEATIRQMLDALTADTLAAEADGQGGYPGYFLPEDRFPYRMESKGGAVALWRPWEPRDRQFAVQQPDGTEVAGDGRDD